MAGPWGFDPCGIEKKVHLWHGEVDRNAPAAMGRFLASAIPNCEAHFCPDEGHLSLFANRSEDVFGVLIA
jgi:pimeloyl-ACP methyl ester carboxylesterase